MTISSAIIRRLQQDMNFLETKVNALSQNLETVERMSTENANDIYQLQTDVTSLLSYHTTTTSTTTSTTSTTTTSTTSTTTTTFGVEWNLASSKMVNIGTITNGDYTSTWTDDNVNFQIQEESNNPAFDITFNFGEYHAVPDTDQLAVTIHGWYEGSISENVILQIYNHITDTWENVTASTQDFPHNTTEQVYNFNLPVPTTNYIKPSGILSLKIINNSAGNVAYHMNIDYITLYAATTTTTTSSTTTTTTTVI